MGRFDGPEREDRHGHDRANTDRRSHGDAGRGHDSDALPRGDGVLETLQQTRGNQVVQRLGPTDGGGGQGAREHNSPPVSGPGSRGEPLVEGDGAVLPIERMQPDAYYRSPVNPENPVLVWTDGTTLHFGPSQSQVESGRTDANPEPTFVPPQGYTAEAIHWDRRSGLVTGGGALVVVATKPGAEDVRVAVSNTLEQRSYVPADGFGTHASHVTRDDAEFLQVDETSVPVGLSGAPAPGPIHQVTFPQGLLRYRAPGGSHDLYVGRDPPATYLVRRATGEITRRFDAASVAAVTVEPTGVAHIEHDVFSGVVPVTTTIDLRESPPSVSGALGHASVEAGYADARARLEAMGVQIEETGIRLKVSELEAIEAALTAGGNRGADLLRQFRDLVHGPGSAEPLLEVTKRVGPDSGRGLADPDFGTPMLAISEPFASPTSHRQATVRHEMTHVLMGAADAVRRAPMSPQERANLEGAMRYEARRGRRKARQGKLRSTEYGAGDRVPEPGSARSWRSAVGEHPELASIWVELLRRYTFIPDPEGTGEFRGVSLADESRYSGASEVASGHPADSASEFVASFVACATVFRDQFREAVLAAEGAGNEGGGRGGSYVRRLYRRTWDLVDRLYVPLGPNPF